MMTPNATEPPTGPRYPLEQAEPHGYDQAEFPSEREIRAASRKASARPRMADEEARHVRAASAAMDGAGTEAGTEESPRDERPPFEQSEGAATGGTEKWDSEDDGLLDGRARLYRD